MRRFARNRGGWPAMKRTIFDAASRRRSGRALDLLYRAQERISASASFDDPPVNLFMDASSRDAWELLQQAKSRVHAADEQAQAAAKAQA